MNTEAVSPRYKGLDTWPSTEVLEALIERQFVALAAVRAVHGLIAQAAEAAALRLQKGGRLAYAGAGTSGRIAVQDAAELPPTFGWPQERLVYLLAGGEQALLKAVEGAEDDRLAGEEAARALGPADVLVAIAASGRTPYTLGALETAKSQGALTVAIAHNPGSAMLEASHHPLLLDTGPEVIAGSTRLAAGTAQKVALNLFSTLTMVRLGRVYDNRMVEVELTNQKLVGRGVRMIQEICQASESEAQQALEQAGGRVSLAVLLLRGLELDTALKLLELHGGLRKAMERLEQGGL